MKNKNEMAHATLVTGQMRPADTSYIVMPWCLRTLWLGLCVFAWFAPASVVLGQEVEPPPTVAAEPEPEVSVPELIERADNTAATIQFAREFLETGELDLVEPGRPFVRDQGVHGRRHRARELS